MPDPTENIELFSIHQKDWGTEYPTSSIPNVVNTQVAYTQL